MDTCPDCGGEYQRIRQHYSMSDCGGDHSSKTDLTCQHCGDAFQEWTYRVENGDGKYCSHGCRDKAHRDGEYVNCDWCGSEIYKQRSFLENNDHFFCDRDCEAEWRSERFTGEGSPSWNGGKETVVCERCGDKYGITPALVDETRYCSWTCKQAPELEERDCAECGGTITRPSHRYRGERAFCTHECYREWMSDFQRGCGNPAWKGGKGGITAVRRMLGDRSWDAIARDVRDDAGHVCQTCGEFQPDRELSAHHIIPVASGGTNDQDLLMALCETCHSKADNFINEYTDAHLLKFVN